MDGHELARRLRADPRLARVALIALTGYGRDDDRCRALAAGFDHHLVKPVDTQALNGLVSRVATVPNRRGHPRTPALGNRPPHRPPLVAGRATVCSAARR